MPALNFERYMLTQLQHFYISQFQNADRDVFSSLSFPHALTPQQLIDFSAYTWDDDGLFLLRNMMKQASNEWSKLIGRPPAVCPYKVSEDYEARLHEAQYWNGGSDLFAAFGIPIDGWVHPDEFETKVEAVRTLVQQMTDMSDDEEETKKGLTGLEAIRLIGPWRVGRNNADIAVGSALQPFAYL
ncbi:hypothetical protein BDW62DRAFT_204351 [Aspergillus aurantiobrunneus]